MTRPLLTLPGHADGIAALLDAMQARCDAATEGPWVTQPFDHNVEDWGVPILGSASTTMGSHLTAYTMTWDDQPQTEADAEFIAAARTDLPRLIAAVRAVLAIEYTDGDDQWDAGYDFALDNVRVALTAALKEADDD